MLSMFPLTTAWDKVRNKLQTLCVGVLNTDSGWHSKHLLNASDDHGDKYQIINLPDDQIYMPTPKIHTILPPS